MHSLTEKPEAQATAKQNNPDQYAYDYFRSRELGSLSVTVENLYSTQNPSMSVIA